jgi:hypothetical protein
MARHDGVTGLPNRLLFHEHLDDSLLLHSNIWQLVQISDMWRQWVRRHIAEQTQKASVESAFA